MWPMAGFMPYSTVCSLGYIFKPHAPRRYDCARAGVMLTGWHDVRADDIRPKAPAVCRHPGDDRHRLASDAADAGNRGVRPVGCRPIRGSRRGAVSHRRQLRCSRPNRYRGLRPLPAMRGVGARPVGAGPDGFRPTRAVPYRRADDGPFPHIRPSARTVRSRQSAKGPARHLRPSDHPMLVADGRTAYLSWQTKHEGYRSIPLDRTS